MKRILWAAALALLIHGVFFYFGRDFFQDKMPRPLTRALSFTLVTTRKSVSQKPAHETAAPGPEKPKTPKKPISEKPVAEKKPAEKETPKKEKTVSKKPVRAAPKKVVKKKSKPRPVLKKNPAPKPVKRVAAPKNPKPVKRLVSKKQTSKEKRKQVRPEPKTAPERKAPAPKTAWPHETVLKEKAESPLSGPQGETTVSVGKSSKVKRQTPAVPRVVDAVPAYAQNPAPRYPRMARRRRYEGTVLLKVLVSKTGRVKSLRVSRSSGYPILDRAALNAVEEWLFEPGTVDGKPSRMWVRVPVRFELKTR